MALEVRILLSASKKCLGLNSAYREKFGDHADILVPFGKQDAEIKVA